MVDTKHSVQLIFANRYFMSLFLEHENNFFSGVNLSRLNFVVICLRNLKPFGPLFQHLLANSIEEKQGISLFI